MPYIPQDQRPQFDEHIFELADAIESPGQLNYVISKLVLAVAMNSEANYAAFNALDGVLGLAQAEFRRRVIFPYEDAKRNENGDLFADMEEAPFDE